MPCRDQGPVLSILTEITSPTRSSALSTCTSLSLRFLPRGQAVLHVLDQHLCGVPQKLAVDVRLYVRPGLRRSPSAAPSFSWMGNVRPRTACRLSSPRGWSMLPSVPCRNLMSLTMSSVRSNCSSVSPQNPTIRSVLIDTFGMRDLILSTRALYSAFV